MKLTNYRPEIEQITLADDLDLALVTEPESGSLTDQVARFYMGRRVAQWKRTTKGLFQGESAIQHDLRCT